MRFAIYTLLALSPLPLASARPVWQWGWILFIAVCGLVSSVGLFKTDNRTRIPWHVPLTPVFCFVLVGCWGLFQAQVPLFNADFALPFDIATLSVSPEQSIKVSILLFAHAALFLVVHLTVRGERKKIAAMLRAIAVIGTLYALYGLVVYFSGANHVLWFEKTAYRNVVTSTFINRNNYAAYAGLGLATMSLLLFLKIEKTKLFRAGTRDFFHAFFLENSWYHVLAYILILSALLLTGSRAGIISVLLAQATFVVLSVRPGDRHRRLLPELLGFLAILLAMLVLSGDLLLERIMDNSEANERFTVYAYVLDAIRERPFTGYGLGSFDEAFRLFRGEDVRLYFDRAHNDYLELAMTAGVPAALVLVAAPILLVIRYLKVVVRAVDPEKRAYAATGIAILVQLGLHSLFDFSLQIPAVSLLLVVLLGLVSARLACSDRSSEGR